MALEDFISMQEKFYNLRKNKSYNIPELRISVKNVIDFKNLSLVNINGWILEICNLSYEIKVCLASSIAYDTLMKQEPNYGELEFQRLIYLKIVLNDLFSFKDKIGYLFYEALDRKVNKKYKKKYVIVEYDWINFKIVSSYLKRIEYEEIQELKYLSEEELKCIKKYFKNIEQIGSEINRIRNKFIHACSVPIDSFGTGIFKKTIEPKNTVETAYQIINKSANKYSSLQDVKEGLEKYRNAKWMQIGGLQEESLKYEDIVQKTIKIWKKYCRYTEEVIKNIEILRKCTVID
ncbi:hypothetical protein [Vallitalea guaymasensis]|uniref:Uncharacterized protein n=1 Tax=Vallitalea guaymasensis TaxID=1185412 RepID=A0A8J8M8F9_9FIRM|nr:hypothetical protein [Vallitalea guaymasensis]QUH28214.1 hypothetical protein HYG85_04505 [Vallitalea guaymasensis]